MQIAASTITAVMDREVSLLALTIIIYVAAVHLHRQVRTNPWLSALLHPLPISIAIIAYVVQACGISYETYFKKTYTLQIMLGPTICLLALPLFRQSHMLSRAPVGVVACILIGAATCTATSILIVSYAPGINSSVLASMASRTATTAVAMSISELIGGLAPLAGAITLAAGIFGAICAPLALKASGKSNPITAGLAVGVTGHALGTARALQLDERMGAAAALAMAANAVLMAIIVPWAWSFRHAIGL